MVPESKPRAPGNRTLSCTDEELSRYVHQVLRLRGKTALPCIMRRLVAGDFFAIAKFLPKQFVDLLILDPPYNLPKNYNGYVFRRKKAEEYTLWFQRLLELLDTMLKPDATIYVCADWQTSTLVQPVLSSRFHLRNRITWEREKGRGAKANWKNNTEDIWFCTKSDSYYFDVEAVKLKRRVLAPYRLQGKPKDWRQEKSGNFRMTHPSNIWTDLTVPFWSMPENTDHPAQKPEKLIAKLILASSREDDFVFDPFVGSGTTAVVAEKLKRRWCGVDINAEYLCWALKRLANAKSNSQIQGYSDGVFWERNSFSEMKNRSNGDTKQRSLIS